MKMIRSNPLTLLSLTLIIFTVFTISLSENLQVADALSMGAEKLRYQVEVGESQMQTWTVQNDRDETVTLEFRAEGKGSEFLIFEKFVEAGPKEIITQELILSVPEDHPDNVEYHVKFYALLRGELPEGGAASGAVVNVQVLTEPIIKIGSNPIYSPEKPTVVIEEKPIEEKQVEEKAVEAPGAEEVGETLEEKMARINAANQAKVDDDFEDSFEEEAVAEYVPEPEYEMIPDKEPVAIAAEEKVECDFFAWFLSLFGIGKC